MQVRVMLKTIFTKAERFLLRNNRIFIMNAESSSESSDDIDSQMYASVLQDLKSKKVEDTPYYSTLL